MGVPFSLRVEVGATTRGTGTILLYRNGELIQTVSIRYAPESKKFA